MVSDNPAYVQVTVQRIELKESIAYHTVHPDTASTHYEEIPSVGGLGEHGKCIKEEENAVYEDAAKIW